MQRHLVGGIGLVCVAIWGWLMAVYPDHRVAAGSCIRIGLVLLAIWLALPQLVRIRLTLPFWLMTSVIVGGLLVAVRPKAAIWVVPLAAALAALHFVGWLFKPLPRKRRATDRSQSKGVKV
jgi:hypothetical protein